MLTGISSRFWGIEGGRRGRHKGRGSGVVAVKGRCCDWLPMLILEDDWRLLVGTTPTTTTTTSSSASSSTTSTSLSLSSRRCRALRGLDLRGRGRGFLLWPSSLSCRIRRRLKFNTDGRSVWDEFLPVTDCVSTSIRRIRSGLRTSTCRGALSSLSSTVPPRASGWQPGNLADSWHVKSRLLT